MTETTGFYGDARDNDDWGTWRMMFRGGTLDGQLIHNESACMPPLEHNTLPDGRVELYVYTWAEMPNGPKRMYEPDEDGAAVYRFVCHEDELDWTTRPGWGIYDGKIIY